MTRTAFVTGGTRGIGKAIVQRLKEDGLQVAAGYSGNTEAAEATARELGVMVVKGNVGSFEDCERAVREVEAQLGPIDVLVNNAGITRDGFFHKMSADQWSDVIRVNMDSVFNMTRQVINGMRDRGFGRIVNISSIAGLYGNAGQASYSSAKASLIGLTRTMCKEWGRYKVNVNCVAFGLINTRLTQPIETQQKTIDVAGRDIKVGVQPQMLEAMGRMIPLGRGGTPEEAADAVYLFCSPESNYISGQVIVAGGGLLI